MRLPTVILLSALISGCHNKPSNLEEFNRDLRAVLATKPKDLGPPSALMKYGIGGPDWLATVHGYPDNQEVCEQFVKSYNEDTRKSELPGTYYCEVIQLTS